jgi:hypothetical protein
VRMTVLKTVLMTVLKTAAADPGQLPRQRRPPALGHGR